jgi:hypothetical protein
MMNDERSLLFIHRSAFIIHRSSLLLSLLAVCGVGSGTRGTIVRGDDSDEGERDGER